MADDERAQPGPAAMAPARRRAAPPVPRAADRVLRVDVGQAPGRRRAAARSPGLVSALVLNKRLRCQPVDISYGRIVARRTLPDGRSLACATIALGAAVRWDRYWRRSSMGKCQQHDEHSFSNYHPPMTAQLPNTFQIRRLFGNARKNKSS